MDILVDVWKNFLVHVLDIAIISYIIFRLLLLFRGTRTIQIFLGIILIFFLTIVSKLLGLKTFNWILNQFWLAGIILAAIIFQQEIRSVLAFLGTQPIGKFFMADNVEFLKETFDAIRELSKTKTGAIIVFERKTGLKNYIDAGTVLNANVKKELILSIFVDKSPLHDGAVIVSNTKLLSAGCILPLSIEKEIPHGATRHRAALGLSEISDAVIIVVSEETGEVSLARRGQLHYNINIDETEKHMLKMFTPQGGDGFAERRNVK